MIFVPGNLYKVKKKEQKSNLAYYYYVRIVTINKHGCCFEQIPLSLNVEHMEKGLRMMAVAMIPYTNKHGVISSSVYPIFLYEGRLIYWVDYFRGLEEEEEEEKGEEEKKTREPAINNMFNKAFIENKRKEGRKVGSYLDFSLH